MKKLLPILFLVFASKGVFAQSLSHPKERIHTGIEKSTEGSGSDGNAAEQQLFNQFAAGLGAVFNGNNAGASLDLSSFTVKYFLVFGRKKDSVRLTTHGRTDTFQREKFKGLDIMLINRASIAIDSLKSIANDYITSLQASPFTYRMAYEGFLTKNREQDESHVIPVVKYRISGDARGIPFTKDNTLKVGGTINGYFSLLAKLRAIQVDNEGTLHDQGSFYFEPSIGFAFGSKDMMSTVFKNGDNKALFSTDIRFGFISDTKRIQDWGFLLRYTWENIIGPKFRVSFNVSPSF